ncbi:YesK family protein [Sporosarcina sp. A2]|uniref:YesK family protein n=1 Tax=Sporosarcina sp. A2 TaxID=3393449 RepID=UPI003D7BA2D3
MVLVPVAIGLILGFLLFSFIYILTKRSEKRYFASLITALVGIFTIVSSILLIGGFEGMGFGIIGIGFVVIAIVGIFVFLFKPVNPQNAQPLSASDKRNLIVIPIVFVIVIVFTLFIS